MPYRAEIESVIHRCDELRARIETLQHLPVPRRKSRTLGDALKWEACLQMHLTLLERNRLDDIDLSPVVQVQEHVAIQSARPLAVFVFVGAAVALGVVCAFAAVQSTSKARPPAFALVAGNVVSARAPAHVGDRCTIRIDRNGEGCDIDAICPTVEKRFHEASCALDRRLSFTTAEAGNIEVELDAWR